MRSSARPGASSAGTSSSRRPGAGTAGHASADGTGKLAAETRKKARQGARRRLALLYLLGDECAFCGTKHDLQPHHLRARTWKLPGKNLLQQARRYEREAAKGLLTPACRRCNIQIGKPRRRPSLFQYLALI